MIRKRKPDKFKAQSMLIAAEIEVNFIKTLIPSRESASTIVRGIYESFRMLGDALLLIHGKEASGLDHHAQMIRELFILDVATARPIQVLLNLKTLRNKINYQGYIPCLDETNEAISILDCCFEPLLKEIKKELDKL